MKLWQKIFLCSLALVILAIDVTSVLLLSNSHRLTVMREEQNAVSEHKYLSVMLKDNVIYERLKQNKVFLTEEEVIQVTQSAFEPQSSARTIGLSLYTGQRRLLSYNGRSEQLEVSILQSASQSSVLNQVQGLGGYALEIVDDGDASYLIVISQIILESQPYYLMTSSDVTEIYTLYKQQLNYVLVMSMICATVIASVLLIVVWLLLLPLRRINEGTRQIAQGNYSKRLPEKGSTEFSQLSRNMNEMAEAIEHNIKDLESVAEDRNTFIANLAHEMKTPAAVIKNSAECLEEGIHPEKQAHYIGMVQKEADHMNDLLMSMLAYTRLSDSFCELNKTDCSLQEMMERSCAHYKGQIEAKNLHVIWDSAENTTTRCDEKLIMMVFDNFISNAVRFCKENGVIRFTISPGTVSVYNEGAQIPEDQLKEIWTPMYKGDSSRNEMNGTSGMGLAISAVILKVHRASYGVHNVSGGVEFYFKLPFKK